MSPPSKVLCMHCCTQCLRPCSRPPLTQASTRDLWTLTGKSRSVSRSVSCGVTAPFSWVLVHTRFCLCPSESISQSCVSSGHSMMGLMVTSSKRAYATPSPLLTGTSTGDTQTQFCLSLCGLGGVLCPSQVQASPATRCLASALSQVVCVS